MPRTALSLTSLRRVYPRVFLKKLSAAAVLHEFAANECTCRSNSAKTQKHTFSRFTQVLPHATLQQAAIPLQILNTILCRPSNSVPLQKHCSGRKLSLRLRRRRSGIQIPFCRPIILPFSLRIAVLLPIINPIPIMQFFYH